MSPPKLNAFLSKLQWSSCPFTIESNQDSLFFFFFFACLTESVSHISSGWSGIHNIAQAALELGNPPALASRLVDMTRMLSAVLLNVFSIAVIQNADKGNLNKNEFILAYHSKVHPTREVIGRQEFEVPVTWHPQWRNRGRGMLVLSSLYIYS